VPELFRLASYLFEKGELGRHEMVLPINQNNNIKKED